MICQREIQKNVQFEHIGIGMPAVHTVHVLGGHFLPSIYYKYYNLFKENDSPSLLLYKHLYKAKTWF